MAEFKSNYTNAQRTHTDAEGRETTVALCDICGAEHTTNYGYSISYAMRASYADHRRKLCGKCASLIIPILEDALETAEAKAEELRKAL